MKKIVILIAGLMTLIFVSCSSNTNKQNFYGTYKFDEVAYLSPLSSSSIDYLNKEMSGAKYIIEADMFKIQSTDNIVEVASPSYVKGKAQFDSSPSLDVHTLLSDGINDQYDIRNKDGRKTHLRLYVSSNYVWLASYVDNTASGLEIIMSIYKLSK